MAKEAGERNPTPIGEEAAIVPGSEGHRRPARHVGARIRFPAGRRSVVHGFRLSAAYFPNKGRVFSLLMV